MFIEIFPVVGITPSVGFMVIKNVLNECWLSRIGLSYNPVMSLFDCMLENEVYLRFGY